MATAAPAAGKSQSPAQPQGATRQQWIVVAAGILGAFMAILDISITNASLSEIQGALSAGIDEGSWISTSYLIAEIMVIPIAGWLASVFSVRRYLLVNATLFLIFSILCGLSWNLSSMIVFRFFQGLTGGILIPIAVLLVVTELPTFQRPIGLALFGIVATFAPALGPTIGGWLTVNYSWEYVFFLNLFPGSLLILIINLYVKGYPSKLEELKHGDWFGIIALGAGVSCLTVVLEDGNRKDWFGSTEISTLACISAVSLMLFCWIELKVAERPIVDFKLFKDRNFSASLILSLALGLGLYGSVYIVPAYLGQIQNYDALQIGEVIMWSGFPQLLILPIVPFLVTRIDNRLLIFAGVMLFAFSCYINGNLSHDSAGDQFRFTSVIRALGQPLIMTPLQAVAYSTISKEQVATASGVFNMMRNLGGSIGIGLLSTIETVRYQFHFRRIAERITPVTIAAQERIHSATAMFMSKGFSANVAHDQAIGGIYRSMTREAYIMAFNDCFLFMAVALAASTLGLFIVKPVKGAEVPMDVH